MADRPLRSAHNGPSTASRPPLGNRPFSPATGTVHGHLWQFHFPLGVGGCVALRAVTNLIRRTGFRYAQGVFAKLATKPRIYSHGATEADRRRTIGWSIRFVAKSLSNRFGVHPRHVLEPLSLSLDESVKFGNVPSREHRFGNQIRSESPSNLSLIKVEAIPRQPASRVHRLRHKSRAHLETGKHELWILTNSGVCVEERICCSMTIEFTARLKTSSRREPATNGDGDRVLPAKSLSTEGHRQTT